MPFKMMVALLALSCAIVAVIVLKMIGSILLFAIAAVALLVFIHASCWEMTATRAKWYGMFMSLLGGTIWYQEFLGPFALTLLVLTGTLYYRYGARRLTLKKAS